MSSKLGGFSPVRNVSANTIQLLNQLQPTILANLPGSNISTFKPLLEKTQIISGVRYVVKIQISATEYIHVFFRQSALNNNLTIEQIIRNQKLSDPL